MKNILIIAVLVLVVLGIGFYVFNKYTYTQQPEHQEVYNPQINSADFTTTIDNPYFSLPIGRQLIFESQTTKGLERIDIQIPGDRRTIMGVETLVYWDRVYLEDVLVEETKDYLAQDKDGNVWYFGEDVDNYKNGQLVDHHGSWIAGEKGALPGIWIKANPQVGDSYRQEYYAGEAEDMSDIVSATETITTQLGTFENCVLTYDWTPLDAGSKENKYYCKQMGGLVLAEHLVGKERTELVEVK